MKDSLSGFFMLSGFVAFAASAYLHSQTNIAPSSPSLAAGVVDLNNVQTRQGAGSTQKYKQPEAILKRNWDGHFWADAQINGQTVEFMVDTGATLVALTETDARRIGVNLNTLKYNWTVNTAGGEVNGAPINIDSLSIGDVEVRNVQAIVLRHGLSKSLLGNSFTRYMHSMEFRGDKLIMRK